MKGEIQRSGSSQVHSALGSIYREGGDSKKTKFHYDVAAMAGDEVARCNLGSMEVNSGNIERAIKHFIAMQNLIESGGVSRESIGSTLTAYNNSCAEMRSEERDTFIRHW